jgi:DNA-binding beta-propeller fold protein YncE
MIRYLAVFTVATLAYAQTGTLDSPTLGYVADSTGAVRPIRGIPASATLGEPIADGLHAIAVRAPYALGIDDSAAAILVTAGGGRTLPIAGATNIFLSPRGTAAAIWRGGAATLDIVTGLPDSPTVLRSIPLDSAPGKLAVSDDGAKIAVLERSRGFDTVLWIDGAAAPAVLHRARRVQSIAILDSAVLIAEPHAVQLVSPSFGPQILADGLDGVLGAAVSLDDARVVIGSASGAVVILDRTAGTRQTLGCSCTPGALSPLRGNSVFRLNDPGDGPLWILDAAGPEPRLLFVAASTGGAQ